MIRSGIHPALLWGKKLLRKLRARPEMLEGPKGVEELGHRLYVGGHWEEMGDLQYRFMLSQGLKPSDCLVDVACGSLRGGRHFIEYLDQGNYLGLEQEKALVELGIEYELGRDLLKEKTPEFVISSDFEFENFSAKPAYGLAQSLFTHLSQEDIALCLGKLRAVVDPGALFFATFFEGDSTKNRSLSHSHQGFYYSRQQMSRAAVDLGWASTFIGDWDHPANSMMMKYEAI